MNPIQPLDFGRWPSTLTPESLFAATESIGFLRPASTGLFFLMGMPEEGNAQVLMFLNAAGERFRVSPANFNIRSQVHEYGGISYAFDDNSVYYCNFSDQRIYRQEFEQYTGKCGSPIAITPKVPGGTRALRYVDLIVDTAGQRLICVREDHRIVDTEPQNALVAIALTARTDDEGEVLFADSDFVASPCLSANGRRLTFQTWSHPNMPWDDTQIRLGDMDVDGRLHNLRSVCPNQPGALVQPTFSPQGDLYFIADWTDWWNLYRIAADKLDNLDLNSAEPVFTIDAEMCGPQWQFGNHSYDYVEHDEIVLSLHRDGLWQLRLLNLVDGSSTILIDELGLLEHVFYRHGEAIFLSNSLVETGAIQSIKLSVRSSEVRTLLRGRSGAVLESAAISIPQHFSYVTANDVEAYGIYYEPHNPLCQGVLGTLPPLIVSVHGGPTGSAKTAFNPAVQFWTSRGYAWLDVNHRGSTGYGRRFRQALYGEWGVLDIEDVVNALQHLIDEGKADPKRIAIRGGSAGGYVVLAALASSDVFRAGASYYGICDLEMLAQDTHKFESRYLDQLIGPYPEKANLYRERSPLHRIEEIDAAVLLLQGRQDKVVPPNQAEAIYQQLHARNPQTRCLYFDDEGHGFRKPQNQMLALQTEQKFYEDILL